MPFLVLGPVLVLAGVAVAFLPSFDPAYPLAAAAAFSGLSLRLARSLSALVTALIPCGGSGVRRARTQLVAGGPAVAVPGVGLLCARGRDGGGPVAAAVVSGAAWVLPVVLVAASRRAIAVVQWHGQLAWAVGLVAGAALAFVRRDRFELGWTR